MSTFCPSCGASSISKWRQVFRPRNDRFRCSSCCTWLVYREAQSETASTRWFRLDTTLSVLIAPVAILVSVAAIGYLLRVFLSHIDERTLEWIAALGFLAVLTFAVVDFRSRYRRTVLIVAEYQMGAPALDSFRSIRDLWRTPEGKKGLVRLAVLSLEFFALYFLLLWFNRSWNAA